MIQFTPGPSEIYFTVPDHIRKALRDGIPSLSHRTKEFEYIFHHASAGLRQLLNIPDNYHLAFTGSATEIWERSVQNLVEKESLHLVNGAFSRKFYETAAQLRRTPSMVEVPEGQGFSEPHSWQTELIAVTINETSTGVRLGKAYIQKLRALNPAALIVIDAVSALPFEDIDYALVDAVFFSVQKGFGLPAGLGVWLYNERCIDKANKMMSKGISLGSYHSIPSFLQHEQKNQTPETPNVLGIYLLGKVIEDFNRFGIARIRSESAYKAAILYQCLDEHPAIKAFVRSPADRSNTVIVAETGAHTEPMALLLKQHGMAAGDGYGSARKTQLRFANFPAHSRETYEKLSDVIRTFH